MIQPPPHKLKCKKCNYSKVVQAKSDAIDYTYYIDTCPKCSGDMEYEEIPDSEQKFSFFRKIFGV